MFLDYRSPAKGGRCSARSSGKPSFGGLINGVHCKKAPGISFLEIAHDRSEPWWFEVTGDLASPPSIDGGIADGLTDLHEFIKENPL